MKTIKDQVGREFQCKTGQLRIVALDGPLTELLAYIGLEQSLVGISEDAVHPFHLKSIKPVIGKKKGVDFESIKALEPDIIIANKQANGFEFLPKLETIAPTYYSSISSLNDVNEMISDFGKIFGRRTECENLIQKIDFNFNQFQQYIKNQPVRKVAFFVHANPWKVIGGDNYTNSLLEINKFSNIFSHMSFEPKVEVDRLRIDGDPEILFLSDLNYAFDDQHALQLGSYTNRSVTVFANGELFSWYGPRLLKALEYFKKLHLKLESHF